MRNLLLGSLTLLSALPCVRAQDQEGKLVNRLLKPDMTLQSSAQNKKFVADRTSINRQATVGAFYVQPKANSKRFYGTRDYSSRQFDSQTYRDQHSAAGTAKTSTSSQRTYTSQTASGIRVLPESDKKVASRAYAENQPFLDQGKSQKSLARKNKPLTIDQVRDLLNKNK